MTVVLSLSEGDGMLFNKRRQSRDRVLIENLMSLIDDKILFITSFSEKLFESYSNVKIIDFPEEVPKEATFFIENLSLAPFKSKIEKMIIYRWNRRYPTDLYLDTPPNSIGLKLTSTMDFAGHSHEKITREIYER